MTLKTFTTAAITLSYRAGLRCAMALCIGSALLTTQPVVAQPLGDDSRKMAEVIVTGSRIKRDDLSGVGPMTIYTAEQIEATGLTNFELLLNRLPETAGFAGNSNAAYWVPGGWGTAQVNLRGLGVGRTLVLINGRRVVFGGSGANNSVDLNMIPTSIVSRVEILKDGASAIYGADAVAGVVNFITRDDFDGLQFESKLGTSSKGDGEETLLGLTWGLNRERGSAMFDISYQNNRAAPLEPRAPCSLADLSGTGQLECTPGSSSTAGGRGILPDGSQINFLGGDAFEPFDIQVHGFNANPFFNAWNPVERLTLSTFGDYAITPNVSLFAEAIYNWRTSNQPGSPATLRDISFDTAHPTNPTGEDVVLLRRRTAEFGARKFEQEVKTFRFVTGFKGIVGDNWNYDVAINLGRNSASDALLNNINTDRLAQTLDIGVCGKSGVPCADLLGEGDLTQEVGDFILINQRETGTNEQFSVTGNVSGSLSDMPHGALGFAAGFEVRRDKGTLEPDALLASGAALGNVQDAISGAIRASEAFAEINVPLLAGIRGIQRLDVDVALRYSDYDLFGGSTNYKAGLNWQVNDALKLRGTYSTAFRVPSVPELFSGVREAQLPTVDPCSDWVTRAASDPIFQNCQAAGVRESFTQFGNIVITDIGGNAALEPEDATTYTLGVVYEPSIIEGLSVTLDWFDIDIEDAINQTTGSTKLAFCYESINLSHPFCGGIHHTRDPLSGDVNFLSAQSANTGNETMSGLDVGVFYDFNFRDVSNSLVFRASYLADYEITSFDGDEPFVLAGGVGCCIGGFPEWKANGQWNIARGKWSGSWNVQMVGSATDFNGKPGEIGTNIAPIFYHNVQAGYQFSDSLLLHFGVDNLFDQDAPFVRSASDGNTDTFTYQLLGRAVYANVRLSVL